MKGHYILHKALTTWIQLFVVIAAIKDCHTDSFPYL